MVSKVVQIVKDVSTEEAYLIIFCISGSIVLIIPNCYPFNIKLKEDIQFKEEDVIRWCVGQKNSNLY